MNRTSRGSKTQAKQTGHSNILGGASSATGIGNGIAGISGGQYSPAGTGAGPNEDGSAGVPIQASVSPVQVNHPVLDAIFNRGQGSQFANQANLGIAMQQLTGQQGLDKTSLENKGRLENTGLEGQNQQANTKLIGQNALNTIIQEAKEGRLTHQRASDLAVLAQKGLTSSGQEDYEGVVQPRNIENMSKQATGEGLLGDIKNNYLNTPAGKANAETGIGAELTSPAAKNQALTKMVLGPGEFGNAASIPLGTDRNGFGGSAGGIKKVSSQTRDPNNPLSLTTTDTETRVPGSKGFMQPPPVSDSGDDYSNFMRSKAPSNVNPALQNSPAPSINQLGISPSDPTIPQGQPIMGPSPLTQQGQPTPPTGIQGGIGSPLAAYPKIQSILGYLLHGPNYQSFGYNPINQ